MTLEELVEESRTFAEKYFAEHGNFPYVWFVFSEEKDAVFPILVPTLPSDQKDTLSMAVRQILIAEKASSYVFMAEAWTVEIDPRKEKATNIIPSQHPNRVEVLSIVGEDGERAISGF